jgi:nitrogen-specific signal transduction histidine kinase
VARPGAVRLKAESLNDIVHDAIDQLSLQLTYRKIVVDMDLATALPPMSLDAERFKGALLNVIVNAADRDAERRHLVRSNTRSPLDGRHRGVRRWRWD